MLLFGAGGGKESLLQNTSLSNMFYYLSIPPEVPPICRLKLKTYPCGKPNVEYFFNMNTMTCEPLSLDLCSKSMNIFPDENACKKLCEPSKSEYFNCVFLFKIFINILREN